MYWAPLGAAEPVPVRLSWHLGPDGKEAHFETKEEALRVASGLTP